MSEVPKRGFMRLKDPEPFLVIRERIGRWVYWDDFYQVPGIKLLTSLRFRPYTGHFRDSIFCYVQKSSNNGPTQKSSNNGPTHIS